jgi:hypothetical protein
VRPRENHVNVIHHDGHGLERDLTTGLCVWVDPGIVDESVRSLLDHIQVSATDLRGIHVHDEATLRLIGPYSLQSGSLATPIPYIGLRTFIRDR